MELRFFDLEELASFVKRCMPELWATPQAAADSTFRYSIDQIASGLARSLVGKKIEAIKTLRAIIPGLGLKEAKNAIDQWM
jgi:ribosomal protein L7/L12